MGGSAAESGGSDSTAGGDSPGGHTGESGAGGRAAAENGGASNHAGASASAGGSGSADAPPDIPRSTLLNTLDDTQKGALCDWHASILGGYGHVSQCGMGAITFYADQATCVSMLFMTYCAKADVGEFVDCASAKIPSNGCDYPYDQCHRLFCM